MILRIAVFSWTSEQRPIYRLFTIVYNLYTCFRNEIRNAVDATDWLSVEFSYRSSTSSY